MNVGPEVDSYLYKALGLEYNEEQKAWMWKGKPVYAIWFADTGLTIYGDVKAEGKTACISPGKAAMEPPHLRSRR